MQHRPGILQDRRLQFSGHTRMPRLTASRAFTQVWLASSASCGVSSGVKLLLLCFTRMEDIPACTYRDLSYAYRADMLASAVRGQPRMSLNGLAADGAIWEHTIPYILLSSHKSCRSISSRRGLCHMCCAAHCLERHAMTAVIDAISLCWCVLSATVQLPIACQWRAQGN